MDLWIHRASRLFSLCQRKCSVKSCTDTFGSTSRVRTGTLRWPALHSRHRRGARGRLYWDFVEQAVYRARKYGRAKSTVNRSTTRFGPPTGLPSPSSQVPRDSMNEDMKRISRRLRELSRPPRPGEPDPLN